MSLTKTSTQLGKIFGSTIGLLLFFCAPFLLDLGFAFVITIPQRKHALSTSTLQSLADYHSLLQYLILIGILSLLTLVGFAIWTYSWKQLDNEAPRLYFHFAIGLGVLTVIINVVWKGLGTIVGFAFQPDLPSFAYWVLYVIYAFGHPILAFLMLRHHWHLLRG